ncbi:class I SAM-dependent methyltransferase [Desmospora activa]|uniref:Methyltransferase family protein n=1 Tax=Desmospora activa DSM 45169 TaxID=1121389 RepID=A0A2T4ZA68_9BACL|nr:class I SAM-dependent methyltransferase [Desmospora activa]PTM58779.1 methyltransferase family protein [Desmospora activa DSM 45169]
MSELRSRLRHAYAQEAQMRDTRYKPEWKKRERQRFASLLKREEPVRLLEIGAGTGQDSLFFHEEGFVTLAIDLSPEMVAKCKEKGLDAQVMDATHLQFPDNSFDAVWSFNCLLHLPKREWNSMLAEIRRILAPGGLFYLGVYGGRDSEGIWEEDHCNPKRFFAFHTNDALCERVEQYFHILDFRSFRPEGQVLDLQALTLQVKGEGD